MSRTFCGMTLSEYLAQPGVTCTALAGKLGVAHSTVLRWASGEISPPLWRLPEISAATDGVVSIGDFIASIRPDQKVGAP